MKNCIQKFAVLLPFVHIAFACFSANNRKQNECAENERWVPNISEIPIGTKKIACELTKLMDSQLLPSELCQKMKNFYNITSELDRKLLHIMWWDEIDCLKINETAVDPFYPFLNSAEKQK